MNNKANKVLISRPDKIGDVILALHCAKQLKKELPDLKVYLHVSEYTYPLVKNIKFIDGCIKVGEDLKPYKFDTVVDLMAKFSSARQYLPPEIPVKIGNAARWFSFIYSRSTIVRRSYARMNEAEYNWRLVQLIDPSLNNKKLTESLKIDDFSGVIPYSHGRPYIVLMPGISVSAQPWSRQGWIELAQDLAENANLDVLFVGGPAEHLELKALENELKSHSNIRYLRPDSFEILLGVLQSASGFVGPSTGITHLASAANLRGIALYPATKSMHPKRWQPFRSSLRVITIRENLTGHEVYQALSEQLSRPESKEYRESISAFIICFNEEDNIDRALKSISWCDEIVIVDSGSTDRTLEICKKYPNVKIYSRDWPGHVAQKQFALSKCTHQWVLNIDADEEISPALRENIERIITDSTPAQFEKAGYKLSRVVRFLDRWWDKGGWYPELRLRLVRKEFTTWGGHDPHEKACVRGKVGRLAGSFYHYTYADITDQIERLNKFSLNSARSLQRQGKRFWMFNLILNPLFRFFKFFLYKKGFLEGRAGFIVAVNEAISTFLKYAKLWEMEQKTNKKEVAAHEPMTSNNSLTHGDA